MPVPEPWALLWIPLFFALQAFWGSRLVGRLDLPGQTALTAAPLSLLVGLSLQMLLVNALSYAVAPPGSFPLAWGLQLASLWWLRGPAPRPLAPVPRRQGAVFAGVAAFTVLSFGAWALTEFQFDNFKQHWLNVPTLLEGNFPIRHALQPDEPVRYHYGAYLLSAQLLWPVGAPFYWAPQLVKTAFVAGFAMLVFGWVAERRGGSGLALLAWLTVCYFVGLPEAVSAAFASDDAGTWLARALEAGQQNEYFHFPSAGLFVMPVACGFSIALATLHLLWRCELRLERRAAALVTALVAALALSATPEFAVVIGGSGLFLLLAELGWAARPEPVFRRRLWLCLAVAVALAAVQGGILSDLLFRPAGDAPADYTLRWPPGMAQVGTWEVVHRVGSRAWLSELLLGPDGLLLLLPFTALACWKSGSAAKALALSWIGGGLLLSHLLEYTPAPFNTNRFLAFALELNLVLLFLLVAEGVAARLAPRLAAVAGGVAAAVAIAGSLPAAAYQARLLAGGGGARADGTPSYLAWWDDPQLLAAAAWIREVTPPGARIATNEPALVVAATGRFAPSGAVVTHGHAFSGGLSDDYSTWTAEAIEASGAGTVCVFRSPLFQAGDVDAAALARDLAQPGPDLELVRRLLANQLDLLQRGAPEDVATAINWVVRWRHRFSLRVDPAAIELPDETRARLGRLRDAPAAWTYVNRAILQSLLPNGTAGSRARSERIDDAHLARYAWVRELERRHGPLAWRVPPFAPERVRCAALGGRPLPP